MSMIRSARSVSYVLSFTLSVVSYLSCYRYWEFRIREGLKSVKQSIIEGSLSI